MGFVNIQGKSFSGRENSQCGWNRASWGVGERVVGGEARGNRRSGPVSHWFFF